MSAFPPQRSTESLRVSNDVALKFLSTYLTATKTSPHLLPNARLEPSGPTSGANNSSIVVHNLLRVEAGLRGEWMAPSLEFGEKVPIAQGMDDGTNAGKAAVDAEENAEGWMDLDQYQREQSIEGGEIGYTGANVVAQEGDSDFEGENEKEGGVVNERDGKDEEDAPIAKKIKTKHQIAPTKVTPKPLDKEARKHDKKARLKAEKLAREKAKQAAAASK